MDQADMPQADEATVNTLMDDLRRVVQDVEALLKATAGQAGDRIGEVRARAEETLRGARARLAEMQVQARDRAKVAAGDADQYVRDNPWQAVGIAAGISFLLGVLVSRR